MLQIDNVVMPPAMLSTCVRDFTRARENHIAAALGVSMKQRRISKKGSRRLFAATAVKTHKANIRPPSSRGGIRL